MTNRNPILCCILGALVCIVNSALLPTWSPTLVGVFSGLIMAAVYWFPGNRMKVWIRVSVSVAVAIAAAAIVGIFCN